MLNLLSLLNYRSPALFSPRFLIAPQFLLRERLVSRLLRRTISSSPAMDREVDSVPHVDRTAREPRDPNLHTLRLEKIEDINSTIRLFKLRASENGVKFLPGQWLDLYLPGVDQAGGFTITSAPAHAAPVTSDLATSLNINPSPREQENILLRPYLELAVQQSPNKPAAWLWRPKSDILGSTVDIRVGGSFVWPPSTSTTPPQDIQKAVFIAGGVGINPLISIISHLHQTDTMPPLVEFIYATKFTTGEILFADRLLHIASNRPQQVKLQFFLTGAEGISAKRLEDGRLANLAISPSYRRLDKKDVLDALRASKKEQTVCYVCGPPQMTDELVEFLRKQEGMSADRVLCEKWW